jgi:hypothetical protein
MLLAAFLAAAAAFVPADASPNPSGKQSPQGRTLVLTAAQMLKLADIANARGDRGTASNIYAALERNPDPDIRAEARFRHAKQLLTESRNRDAALLLRSVVDEKPGAVLARVELAHALDLLGESDAALRELRAAQSGGLPPAVARLIDRYSQAIRAARPAGASLEITLAPDSNINNATRSDHLGTIFGDFDIDQQSKAKSGTGLSLHGQAYRRLSIGRGDDSLLFRVSGFADLYRKMKFNDVALDLVGGPELRIGRSQLNLELGATQRWFGQKPFTRSIRVGALWTQPLGTRMQVRLTGTAALIDNQVNDLEDGKSYAGRIEFERALSETTGIGLNLSAARQSLRDPGYSTTGWRAGLLGWRDIGRMTFTAEADYGRLQADERLRLFPDKRGDHYCRLSIGATFRQLQFRGFAPIVRFTVERNRSTIAFYDYSRKRTEVGFERAF